MSWQEYGLLAMVIVVPLVIATVVTLWTLEQARMRSKKNRRQAAKNRLATPPDAKSG